MTGLPYRCANKRCPNKVAAPGKRCPACRKTQWEQQDAARGTSTERGYDKTWRRIRTMFLAQHPICAAHERNGRIVPATEVHHKIALADGGTNEDENLEALCHRCHSAETMRTLNRRTR